MSRRVAEPPAGDIGPDADPESFARTILLRRLTVAPRTAHELRSDLVSRGVPVDVIERLLSRFTELGLVDDAEYARMWVASRHRSRGAAPSVLRQELRHKGVDDDLVEEALTQISVDDQRERARRLVEQKLRALSSVEPQARTRRLVSLLQRRGYSPGLSYAVVREVLSLEAIDVT